MLTQKRHVAQLQPCICSAPELTQITCLPNPGPIISHSSLQTFEGTAFTTFKLHLAACHLADQVRCTGASFFCQEFWVERMVQLYKQKIKYRSTAHPELLFINDELLVRACWRIFRKAPPSLGLCTITEAVNAVRSQRRRTPSHRDVDDPNDNFFGAPKKLTAAEYQEVAPRRWDGESQLTGLLYLLVQ